ncbi:MAG: ParB/RepB/Spo0J family partition protein [Patescibacteria group bacterium]
MSDTLKGSGLGRGLSSLIPKRKTTPLPLAAEEFDGEDYAGEGEEVLHLSPREIAANPYQPRRDWADDSHFLDLVESVKKHGILQPLVVTRNKEGRYEVVAGERRLRAARHLNLARVPCVARSVGELEKLELSLIENIQRKDLNPIERAYAYRKLIDEFSLSHEEAAKRLGKSRPVVTNTLRLLQLPSDIQKSLAEGKISEGQAKTILELKTEEEQRELYRRIVEDKLTVADARTFTARRGGGGQRRRGDQESWSATSAVESALEEKLGTKVRVRRKGKGGEIVIEFYSEEEFGEIVRKLLHG